MIWKWTADAVAVFHLLWIAGFLLGPAVVFFRRSCRVPHLLLIWITLALWRFYCPLTVFENALRSRYDPGSVYETGFLERCFGPLADLAGAGRWLNFAVIAWTVGWTLIYFTRWKTKSPASKKSQPE